MAKFSAPAPKSPVPGFFARAKQAVRWTIQGVDQNTFMSPLQPIGPFTPVVEGRQWDYRVGYNISYTPRGNERFSFQQLRAMVRGSDLMRIIIQGEIEKLTTLEWVIKGKGGDELDPKDPRIAELTQFFECPDKVNDWASWLGVMMEEYFVTDAVSIYLRPNKANGLYAAELVDGATIFPLIDATGRRPTPPNPAFQQILKGLPKVDYTSDELIYAINKTQINTPYGWSAVEQVANSISQDIERARSQLAYFTNGVSPDTYAIMPDGMTPDMLLAFEMKFNQLMAGNLEGRRQMPFFPAGSEINNLPAPTLKDDFDEWLARKFCAAIRVAPTPYIKQLNRSTSESSSDDAEDAGFGPRKSYIKRQINRIIRLKFGYQDLEFAFAEERDQDQAEAATIDKTLTAGGIVSINEVRHERGLEPVPGGDEPMALTATGWVPLPGSPLDVQMQQQAAEALAAQQQHEAEMAAKQPEDAQNPSEDDKNTNGKQPKGAKVKKKPIKSFAPHYPATKSNTTPPRH